MMVPELIIVDETGPKEGADIKPGCVVVRESNLKQIIEGFSFFMPDTEFKIYTKVEYEAYQEKEKAGKLDQAEKKADPGNQ